MDAWVEAKKYTWVVLLAILTEDIITSTMYIFLIWETYFS